MKDWGYAYIYNPTCPEEAPYDYEEYRYDREKKRWITIKRKHCVPHYNEW